ncbi:hypothetical protein OG948_51525 (plasmid) [Embleya sp. NBC_00888]|uniref:hypothetical protein n=1 Tax=Embleya sp. NBC_00888 TaxID=2975960 RepID=UPI002F9182DC|nr:hypothetical protein OG948_51525 [Embleya sp. NBC_00888]
MPVTTARWALALAATLFATVLTACGEERDSAGPSGPTPSGPTPSGRAPADTGAQARRDAEQAADRWEADHATDRPRAFIVGDPYPTQLGNWEAHNHAFKVSLADGCFAPPEPGVLPPTPVDGEVRWADGVVQRRPSKAPLQGFGASLPAELKARCGTAESPRLTVASATATTRTVQTTEGAATVPAWEITFAGTSVRVTTLAVTSDPPPSSRSAIASASSATVGADDRTVIVGFSGAPDGPGPCGSDYELVTVQRDKVVAVAVVTVPKPGPTAAADGRPLACPAIAALRTETVTLDAPLGNRALIDTDALPLAPAPAMPQR